MRVLTAGVMDLLASGEYAVHARARIEDPDGNVIEVEYGADDRDAWLVSAEWGEDLDQPVSEATIRLRRSAEGALSLAPLMEGSPINRDGSGQYAPRLDLARRIVLEVQITAPWEQPSAAGWLHVFDGYVDRIDWSGPEAVLYCRDLGALLVDSWVEEESEYGAPDTGVPLEDVAQAILDDWCPGVTVYAPDPPGFMVTSYRIDRQSVMDALENLVQKIGWAIRYRWDSGAGQWRLTIYDPGRDKTTPDATIGPDDYADVTTLEIDRDLVRNVVEVEYRDAVTNERTTVVAQDPQSIARYGRRWMRIEEADDSPIDTAAEAQAMADAALSDLAWPDAEQAIEMLLWPAAEIGDLYRFRANDGHYDRDHDWAVTSVRHQIALDRHRTTIRTRGKPAGMYRQWFRASSLPPGVVLYAECQARIVSSTATTVTVEVLSVPPYGTVELVSVVGATLASGPAIGTPSPSGTRWTFNRPAFQAGAGQAVFRAEAPGYQSDDDHVVIPEQGRDTVALAMRARVVNQTATTLTVRVAVADPQYSSGSGNVSVAYVASGGVGGVTPTSPQTIAAANLRDTPDGSEAAGGYVDFTIARGASGSGGGRVTFTASRTGRVPDVDAVDVPELPPSVPVEALPPTARIEYVSESANTFSLRYTGQLGTGATGPLQYRRRLVFGSVPGTWGPGPSDGWVSLPGSGVIEAVPIPPKVATVVELEVRDEDGRVGRDTYDIAPRLPVIGGDGRLNPDEQPYDDPLAPPLRDVVDGSGRARAGLTEGGRVKLGVEPTADIAGAPAQDVTADAQTGRRVFEAGMQGARNLLANPGFEEGEDFWWRTPGSGGSWSVPDNPANAHSGRRYAAVNCSGDQQQTLVYAAPRVGAAEGRYIEVSEGDVVRWGAWVRRVTGDGLCRVRLALYDADRAAINFPNSTDVTVNTWTLSEGQVTIPAGVQYIRLALQVYQPTTDTTGWFDDVYLSIASDLDRHVADGATYRRTTRNEADGGGRAYTTIEPGGGVLSRGVTIDDGVSPKVPVTGVREFYLAANELEPVGNPGDPNYRPAVVFDPPYQDAPLVIVQGPMAYAGNLPAGHQYRREWAEGITAGGIHRIVAQLVSKSAVTQVTENFPSGTISGEGATQEHTLVGGATDGRYTISYDVHLEVVTGPTPGSRGTLSVTVAIDSMYVSGGAPIWVERHSRTFAISATAANQVRTLDDRVTAELVLGALFGAGDKIRVRIARVVETTILGDVAFDHHVDPDTIVFSSYTEQATDMAQDGERVKVIVMGAS